MDVRFVSYSELKTYFEKERLEKDLEERSKIGICSTADLLFVTEDYKKRTLNPRAGIENAFEKFQKGPEASGQIYVADLDRERLSDVMFEKLIEGVELWETAASSKLSPRHSITYLTLRVTPDTWWPEEVFDEMYNEYGLDNE